MKPTPEEEEFNLRYRPGGGFPHEEHEHTRDCITEMRQTRLRPDMLWNSLAAMGCAVIRSEAIYTGCGGL